MGAGIALMVLLAAPLVALWWRRRVRAGAVDEYFADLVPGSLTHVMGDAHVYLDHEEALKIQLEREPREFPELEIAREAGGSIDGWKVEDFIVKGYDPHKTIAMKMSV